MIVLDACVVIAFFRADDPHATAALEIVDTEEELYLHPLTLAECAVGPAKTGTLADFRRGVLRLGLNTWVPDDGHSYRLAILRATTPCKLPDCCVLDTARTLGARLATFDAALAKVARAVGVEVTR
ncbi:MAG: PIN domain-containing protein [Propionibacteriaceae bacterium]|nr:PIN domain-containing protein [Propionibacteriaceae bacterium]